MPHFSKDQLAADPDGLARLHAILHGRSVRSRQGASADSTPTLEARFGTRSGSCAGPHVEPAPRRRRCVAGTV